MQRYTPKKPTSACEILKTLLKNPPKQHQTHITGLGFPTKKIALPSVLESKFDTYDKHIAEVVRTDAACRNNMVVDEQKSSSTWLCFTTKEDYEAEQNNNSETESSFRPRI